MKSNRTAILLVIIAMFFVGCSKNMDYPDPVVETLTSGDYSVNFFFEAQDKTASYSGYVFGFENDGSLVCSSPNGEFQGTWKLLKKVDGPAISISLPVLPSELQDLSREWDVKVADNSTVELKNTTAVFRLRK
jgi:hypothetical protein